MDTNLFDPQPGSPLTVAARVESRLAALARLLWLDTLKGRLVAGALVATLTGIAVTALHMGTVAERELLAMAEQREHFEAGRTRAAVARRLDELQRALQSAAAMVDKGMLHSPRGVETFLERQPLLRSMFSSLFLTNAEGRVLVLADSSGIRRSDIHLGDRDYLRRSVVEKRAVISDPVPSRVSAEPVVVLTHPVLDAGGVQAVVGGALRLASRDLLEHLAESRDDDDSQTLVVLTDDMGRIIAHPQRTRLMQTLDAEPRFAPAYARWVAGGRQTKDPTGGFADPREVIGTAAVPGSRWLVWRATPRAQVLAPLQRARQQATAAAGGMALVLACGFIVFIARQLQPLHELKRRAAALLEGQRAGDDDNWPEPSGEIGELSRTLRHVWAERTQAEAFNAQVLQKLSSVMAASPVGLAFTRNKRFELVSTEICRMLGRGEDSLVGHPTELIFSSHDDYVALGPQVVAAFEAGEPYNGEWQLVRADGSLFWGRLRARPVVPGDPASGTIWSMYDISDQVDARNRLQHAATHDELTGVLNRKGFEQGLHEALARDTTPAAVVMIDLDEFKPINDSAGHAAGDAMLKAVARTLVAQVRASDAIGRLGGDEFALLLHGCDQARACTIAEKVRLAIRQLAVHWEGKELKVGASIGVAERGTEHETIAKWLADADAACYDAKRSGRDKVVVSGTAVLRLVGP